MRIAAAAEQAGVNVQSAAIAYDRTVAGKRVKDIERKIAELHAMKQALSHLVHCCEDGSTLECPIIEALDGVAEAAR